VGFVAPLGLMVHNKLLSWLGMRSRKDIFWSKLTEFLYLFDSFFIHAYTLYTCIYIEVFLKNNGYSFEYP
jgi:hypothetical protein